MKVVAVSDLHGYLPAIEPCDLLILAGDLCPNFSGNHEKDRLRQAAWLASHLRPWLAENPVRQTVAIWGNHDFVGQRADLIPKGLNWVLLNDQGFEFQGLKIWGTPWTPTFFNWAFMQDEDALEKRWEKIPAALDILVSHGPPYGYCDGLRESGGRIKRCGSKALLEAVSRTNPAHLICGHIHDGRGEGVLPVGGIIRNVAYVDEAYKPRQVPAAFEIHPGEIYEQHLRGSGEGDAGRESAAPASRNTGT